MADATAVYHVEFAGSNLGLDLDPLAKADEIENILNNQWVNGYQYDDFITVSQANEKEYTYMIFKERLTTDDAPLIIKKRIRNKKY